MSYSYHNRNIYQTSAFCLGQLIHGYFKWWSFCQEIQSFDSSLQYFCGDIIAYLHCMSCLILLLTILLWLTSSFWSTDKPDACPVAIYHWLGWTARLQQKRHRPLNGYPINNTRLIFSIPNHPCSAFVVNWMAWCKTNLSDVFGRNFFFLQKCLNFCMFFSI